MPRHLALLLLAFSFAPPLTAQQLSGRLLDGTNQRPLVGALVELRDSTGAVRARGLSGSTGVFRLAAPSAGRWRWRAIAIGYSPGGASVLLQSGAEVALGDLEMMAVTVQLPDIEAVARRDGCTPRGDDAMRPLIEAIEGSLAVMEAAVLDRSRSMPVEWVTRRDMETARGLFRVSDDTVRERLTAWPIRSAPPEVLEKTGFADAALTAEGRRWYGPDLAVLSADWFHERYCFRVEPPTENGDLVVTFAPHPGGTRIEIRGKIRLDRTALAVRALEYEFVQLPTHLRAAQSGGNLRFAPDGEGVWRPVEWRIWAPIEQLTREGRSGRTVPTGVSGKAELSGRVAPAAGSRP